jgi:hypothetical protein
MGSTDAGMQKTLEDLASIESVDATLWQPAAHDGGVQVSLVVTEQTAGNGLMATSIYHSTAAPRP